MDAPSVRHKLWRFGRTRRPSYGCFSADVGERTEMPHETHTSLVHLFVDARRMACGRGRLASGQRTAACRQRPKVSRCNWRFRREQPRRKQPNGHQLGRHRRALIVCGLSGGTAHRKLFVETTTKLHEGLAKQLGFAEENVHLLFGDDPQDSDIEPFKSAPRSTREELEQTVTKLREQLRLDDALWLIVVGHSHYDGKHSWLNLPGPDIHQLDFAKLFTGITAAQQVFVITTPTSGYYIKPLSAKGRVVMKATETDWETNETEFPHELARILFAPPAAKDFDVDGDGVLTLFDFYVTVVRNLAQSYLDREFLATEPPLLDDNGDGRGTEVQLDFFTVEQGGRAKPKKWNAPTKLTTTDGGLARTIARPLAKTER